MMDGDDSSHKDQCLIGGKTTPLKNDGVRQIGSSTQLLGKIKVIFQTTNKERTD
jgi:hypothetical protein